MIEFFEVSGRRGLRPCNEFFDFFLDRVTKFVKLQLVVFVLVFINSLAADIVAAAFDNRP